MVPISAIGSGISPMDRTLFRMPEDFSGISGSGPSSASCFFSEKLRSKLNEKAMVVQEEIDDDQIFSRSATSSCTKLGELRSHGSHGPCISGSSVPIASHSHTWFILICLFDAWYFFAVYLLVMHGWRGFTWFYIFEAAWRTYQGWRNCRHRFPVHRFQETHKNHADSVIALSPSHCAPDIPHRKLALQCYRFSKINETGCYSDAQDRHMAGGSLQHVKRLGCIYIYIYIIN